MPQTRLDWLIMGVLALTTSAYVVLFHFPAPYFDHWDVAPLLEAADRNALDPRDLFAIHGGHWHAGAYAVMLALAPLTGWSQLAEALASLAFMFAAAVLLARMGVRFGKAAAAARPGMFAIVAVFLVFALDQASNLLWTFQLSVFTSVFGAALCLAALSGDRLDWRHALAAQAGLTIAVTSYATGFALIPVAVALILARSDVSWRWRGAHALIWVAISAAWCWAFVLLQRTAPHGGGFDAADLRDPAFFAYLARFELAYLGAAVARIATSLIVPLALIGPAAAIACAVFLARRGVSWRILAAPLALCAFSLGAGLLCGLGRFDFGAGQGGNGRYFSFSALFWLGAAWLILAAAAHMRAAVLRRGVLAALVSLAALKCAGGVQAAQKTARVTAEVAAVADAMRADPARASEAARAIAWDRQDIERHVAFIRDKRWSVFARRAR